MLLLHDIWALHFNKIISFCLVLTRNKKSLHTTGIVEFVKEMEENGIGKPKVTLQFELSTNEMAQLIKAEAVVKESVFMVQEEQVVKVEDKEIED